jgi:hypothetical protein
LQGLVESLVTRLTRSVFWAFTTLMRSLHTHNDQRHSKLLTQGFAVGGESIGRSLQSMVHMDSVCFARPTQRAGDQERGGIGPTAESNGPSG